VRNLLFGTCPLLKYWAKVAGIPLFVFAMLASAQSGSQAPSRAQESHSSGFWTDPATSLLWTRRDSGKDVSWKKAVDYCRDLRLGGYSDWRLPSLAELKGIYDPNAEAPGLAGAGDRRPFTWHVRGNLFLTGDQWSSSQRNDDRGHPSGYAWYFDFNEGRSNNEPTGFPYSSTNRRALCVRGE